MKYVTVTIDAELRAKLGGLEDKLTLRDEAGQVVGHVVPPGLYEAMLDAFAGPPMTPEQRAAMWEEVRSGKALTTAQVIARLTTGRPLVGDDQ
ncbi:MAG: hypothetical protein K2X87_23825 [Gemmataceae bacterium]|nr:hypothetical protein [Gemmataceae bacterium]